MPRVWKILALAVCSVAAVSGQAPDRPFHTAEFVFPLEHWHNHASTVVELPSGDLFVCWFHGSGERTADDVVVRGARLRKGSRTWSAPFLLADTPGYPDTNPTIFLDPKKRLWLLWPTILANEWHTALMKYKISSDYRRAGVPRWDVSEVLHVTPGDEFKTITDRELDRLTRGVTLDERRREYVEKLRRDAGDNGHWVLAHNDLEQGRWSLALSVSEDEGATWPWTRHLERDSPSDDPLQRGEYHYPSIMQAKDGTLHASYSYFIQPAAAKKDAQGRAVRKAIKHAHFNEAWIREPE